MFVGLRARGIRLRLRLPVLALLALPGLRLNSAVLTGTLLALLRLSLAVLLGRSFPLDWLLFLFVLFLLRLQTGKSRNKKHCECSR